MNKKFLFPFAVFFALSSTAYGATDYLLKLGGVDGETTKSAPAPLQVAPVEDRMVACTADAKMCPDGSYVGRTGPACEFSPCPSSTKTAPPPPPRPSPTPSGDPDFDLLKIAPPPVSSSGASAGEPANSLNDVNRKTIPPQTNPIYKDDGMEGKNPMHEGDRAIVPPPHMPQDSKKGNVEMGWKVEEGEKSEPGSPDMEIRDEDDDGDVIDTIDEGESVSVSKVVVRGWDPKKKEEFMSERKEATEVHSKKELEHFAQGVLLDDEQIEEVQFNPKEISISYKAEGKMLWFIPVTYDEELVARGVGESDVAIEVRKPWWGFLVAEDDDDDALAEEAKRKHKETIEISSWSWGVSNQAGLLKTLSNVLKTKHDTAKNSIGNIR